jgi:hypothetical protein
VPLDGSRPRIRIDSTSAGAAVVQYEIAPDSTSVGYRAGSPAPGTTHLFRVPIDGSRAPTRVDEPQVTGGDVTDFRFAADGRTIVYRADQEQNDVFELFASAGGHSPRPASVPASVSR